MSVMLANVYIAMLRIYRKMLVSCFLPVQSFRVFSCQEKGNKMKCHVWIWVKNRSANKWKICQLLSNIDSLFIKRNFIWIQSSLQSSKIRQYSQNCYQLVTTAGTSPQPKQTNWEDSAGKKRNSLFDVKAWDVKMWLN